MAGTRLDITNWLIADIVAMGGGIKEVMVSRNMSETQARQLLVGLGYSARVNEGKQFRPDKQNRTRKLRGDKARAHLDRMKDRRRAVIGPVAPGEFKRIAPEDLHGTVFTDARTSVADAAGAPILRNGGNCQKLGNVVSVGWLKGAEIYTFALEERATCPRTCKVYRQCYGNNLPKTRRWKADGAFLDQLYDEIGALLQKHERILIRIHELGDFPSLEYLAFWFDCLDEYPGLNVFGFTAHPWDSEIGRGVRRMHKTFGKRWSVRFSGRTGAWGAFVVPFDYTGKFLGDAVMCPEQRAQRLNKKTHKHCGSCGVCFERNVPIGFVAH